MKIKKASIQDAEKISVLINKNIDANPNQYTQEQMDVWKTTQTPSKIKQQFADRTIFCAFEQEKLLGTIALQDNDVVGFYVNPHQRGKGIGGKLLQHIEQYAQEKQLQQLHLFSTPSAVSFYENKGFVFLRKVKVTLKGIDYCNESEMVKKLNE